MDALSVLKAEASGEKLLSWDSVSRLWPRQPSSSTLNIIVKVMASEYEQFSVRLSLLTRFLSKSFPQKSSRIPLVSSFHTLIGYLLISGRDPCFGIFMEGIPMENLSLKRLLDLSEGSLHLFELCH